MSQFLFANNAASTLAGAINNIVVSATLAAGTGALFPNPGANQQFALTFTDVATGLLNEIVYVTTRSGDVVTIVRGQEGTAAQSWSAGDLANNRLTAGQMASMNQSLLDYAVDTGAANAYVVTIPGIAANTVGLPLSIKVANSNSGASTLNVNGIGAIAITGGGTAIAVATLIAGCIYTFIYDGTSYQVLEANALGAAGGGGGGPFLIAADNLSDLTSVANARANLVVPTRTGGNASGTWGIDISGTAAVATSANGLNAANSYSAVNFTATSDQRLKDRAEPVSSVLDQLARVQAFYYTWNATAKKLGYDDDRVHIGVAAQDLMTVDPALVRTGENEVMGINVSDTIALLIHAINELRGEVQQLRAERG